MSNDEAIELLRNTGPVVHLVIARVLEETMEEDGRTMKRGLSQEDILQALANDDLYGKITLHGCAGNGDDGGEPWVAVVDGFGG